MAERMSRREFLRTAVLGAGVGALAHVVSPKLLDFIAEQGGRYEPTFGIFLKEHTFNYDFASQLTVRFDRIWKAMTPELLPADDDHVDWWIDEMAPFFSKNGIFPEVRFLDNIGFKKYARSFYHTDVLGSGNCETYIDFNYRFANPVSSWHNSPLLPSVIIHEFDHFQQGDGCNSMFYTGPESIEQHAVVAAYEVLAYLANNGNRIAATSLVYSLRRELFRAAWGLADEEGRLGDFDRLCAALHDGRERAEIQQVGRELKKGRTEPKDAFRMYSVEPLRDMIDVYFQGKDYPKTVTISVDAQYNTGGPGRNFEFPGFSLDDVWYFMAHAEELTRN